MKKTVCFDDVLLVPQYSEIESRAEVDLSVPGLFDHLNKLVAVGKQKLTCPIIGSPMDTVMGVSAAFSLSDLGGFGVLHRYCSIEEARHSYVQLIAMGGSKTNVMVAIGATGDYLERATELFASGCRAFCIDVAHGHHVSVKKALETLRNRFGNMAHLMGGNVSTLESFNDLADWGCDSIRVSIGGGSVCSTRIQTGHGVPTLGAIMDCAHTDRSAKIVADGGIRNSGDAVKALAAGADYVMLGSVLAGHHESPGEVFNNSEGKFKVFRGMASKEAQLEWRGRVGGEEGVSTFVPFKGHMKDTVDGFLAGMRSGLSYSGARNIPELQRKAVFVEVSSNAVKENHPHGKR